MGFNFNIFLFKDKGSKLEIKWTLGPFDKCEKELDEIDNCIDELNGGSNGAVRNSENIKHMTRFIRDIYAKKQIDSSEIDDIIKNILPGGNQFCSKNSENSKHILNLIRDL